MGFICGLGWGLAKMSSFPISHPFMHRFTQKFLPESFHEVWVRSAVRNIGENEIQIGNADQLQIVGSTLASLNVLPLTDFPKIWKNFPDEQIKFVRKISEFDTQKKQKILDDLSEIVVCNRLLCPACRAGQPR